jgi:hypothetical protein
MPATTATFAETHRTCNFASHVGERTLPFTSENFYIRPDGSADYWCRECVRAYNRSRRTAGDRRKFGVEIEYIGSYDGVLREMRARGLEVNFEGYTHRVTPGAWKIVTDGSINGGYELVSPPLSGANGRRQVKLACEAMQAAGVRVNNSCGLHVHHDIHDLDAAAIGRLATLWSNNQRNINWLVAASRRDSQWAQPLSRVEVSQYQTLSPDRDLRSQVQSIAFRRYRSLNFLAYVRYGTVEVRQHQGTLNAKKMLAWIDLGQAVIRSAKAGDTATQETTAAFLGSLSGLAASTRDYLTRRATTFAGSRASTYVGA